MHQGLRTLDQLPIGASAVVHHVGCDRPVARRLMEMGLLPGTRVETIRRAPLGDPLKIRLRGYLLSLRLADAARIQLTPEGRTDIVEEAGTGGEPYRFGAHETTGGARTTRVPRVLVAGNANSGKTTVFNALTGARAQIGNYPGVTVTRSSRRITLPNGSVVEIVDLPGTYSLSAHSPDEQVAVDEVLGRRGHAPDAVIVVVDSGALERGLYLVLQIAETGVPVVVALNMIDEANAAGADLDAARLGTWLGATVVPTIASQGVGLDELRTAVGTTTGLAPRHDYAWTGLPAVVEREVATLTHALKETGFGDTQATRRSWALWSLLSLETDDGAATGLPTSVRQAVQTIRQNALSAQRDLDQEIIASRYRWIEAVVNDVRSMTRKDTRKWTNRLDAILTQRVYGLVVFAVVMAVLFEALFTWSEPLISAIETATGWLQTGVTVALPTGILSDLMVEGVIAGVGNVVVFVPQIAMLCFFIAMLEDVGYLARVAFIIDRLMGRVGLHGKAFVPMLSGFACAIPAVMATRTIESPRDRLITMLTLPMVSCSARLPVYALVTAVIFSSERRMFGLLSVGAVVLFSMYALSVVATLGAAAVLRRTVLRGPRLPLLLELPPYRVPVWSNVLLTTWRRVRKFLEDAGTIILTMTIILWALLSFPHSAEIDARYDAADTQLLATTTDAGAREAGLAELSGRRASEQLRYSVGGRLGRVIEPVIEPLGFDWRIGVGILGAFAAREVFVSTLGIVFGIAEADEESVTLRASLQNAQREGGTPLMTPLTGVSLMVFFVLACQCMSTIVVVRKESGSWGWPLFMFGYMSVLAYTASLAVYQIGSALEWGIS
ncbi:MAG TPA: ferrous iron transport protein B [Vicinamibacterales bacterium]|nr:ferrous iron transport protein B [Vicinamibacterales bacterium]